MVPDRRLPVLRVMIWCLVSLWPCGGLWHGAWWPCALAKGDDVVPWGHAEGDDIVSSGSLTLPPTPTLSQTLTLAWIVHPS